MPALSLASTTHAFEQLTAKLGIATESALCIHTERASLKLDAKGICRDVFTLDGSPSAAMKCFIGAQYVGSIDRDELSAEPNVGCHALLVDGVGSATPSLIKTARITGVVYDSDVVDPN
jgi:hypothetical protein